LKQFTIRVGENLLKLDRVEKFHRTQVPDAPEVLFEVIATQRERLLMARERFGDHAAPEALFTE
jgi:phosphoenolpyruvate carboxykinase (GTP)